MPTTISLAAFCRVSRLSKDEIVGLMKQGKLLKTQVNERTLVTMRKVDEVIADPYACSLVEQVAKHVKAEWNTLLLDFRDNIGLVTESEAVSLVGVHDAMFDELIENGDLESVWSISIRSINAFRMAAEIDQLFQEEVD